MSRMPRTAGVVGAVAAMGALALAAPAQAAQAAPAAAAAAKGPWMSVSLSPTVKGDTLTYRYSEKGAQRLVVDSGTKKPYDNKESAGYGVFIDGKLVDGGDGLGDATCTTKGLASFSGRTMTKAFRFAKPGKHTVRVVGSYCGAKGLTTVSKTYTVTSTAKKPTGKPAPKPAPKPAKGKASLKAVGTFTAGKPLRLNGQCTSTAVRTASVVGPRNIKATLKRTTSTGALTGSVTVPKELKGNWVRLRITCSDGATNTAVITRTGAKTTSPAAR